MKSLFPLFIFVIAILQSCTIEKRLYNNGFHVQWNKHFRESNSFSVENNQTDKVIVHSSLKIEEELKVIDLQDSLFQKDLLVENDSEFVEKKTVSEAVLKKGTLPFLKKIISKAKPKSVKSTKMGRGSDVTFVLLILLFCVVILPIIYFLFLLLGESLEIVLLWLGIILIIGLIVFFIVRMFLTATRY